jgi:hypothetical protein
MYAVVVQPRTSLMVDAADNTSASASTGIKHQSIFYCGAYTFFFGGMVFVMRDLFYWPARADNWNRRAHTGHSSGTVYIQQER